jgi:glutamate carboxypeptidase
MDFNLFFRSRQGEMVGLLKELVQRESPTSDKKAVDACSAFYLDQVRTTGARISRFPQKKTGDFYVAEYPLRGERDLDGRILLLTHIDTVWPVGKIAKMPFYASGDKVFGPGVLDMKAGLVLAYFALKTLNDLNLKPRRKIVLFVNPAEEIGCEAAHDMIRSLARKADAVLCLEPALPGGALKVQRKGRLVIRLEAFGKSAHGGTPEKGVNAVEELLAQLRRVLTLKSKEISVNVGLIAGGEKANVVPDKAWAVCDLRFWSTLQKEKIIGFFKMLTPTLRGSKIKYGVESLTPPMEKTKASSALFNEAQRIGESLGIRLEGGKTGGGSDGSIAAGLGVATLDGLGPDGDGIHAENEHLILTSLPQRAALLVEMLKQL